MKKIGLLFVVLLSGLTTACDTIYGDRGVIHDRSNNYLNSRNGKILVVPPVLDNTKITNQYHIKPVRGYTGEAVVPPGSLAATIDRGQAERMQPAMPATLFSWRREGDNPILLIHKPFPQAWTVVSSGIRRRYMPMVEKDRANKRYTILDIYPTNERVTPATPSYQLRMQPQGEATSLRVTTLNGRAINEARAKRLLTSVSKGMQGYTRTRSISELLRSYMNKRKSRAKAS